MDPHTKFQVKILTFLEMVLILRNAYLSENIFQLFEIMKLFMIYTCLECLRLYFWQFLSLIIFITIYSILILLTHYI